MPSLFSELLKKNLEGEPFLFTIAAQDCMIV